MLLYVWQLTIVFGLHNAVKICPVHEREISLTEAHDASTLFSSFEGSTDISGR